MRNDLDHDDGGVQWVDDGHEVVPSLDGRTARWGWRCPYDGVAHPEPPPPCRVKRGRHVRTCIVAPWFNEAGGVVRCMFPAGRRMLPRPNPIRAEYADFGGYFRWRPVGGDE